MYIRSTALEWSTAVLLSLILHGVLFGLLLMNFDFLTRRPEPRPLVIQATVVDTRAMLEREREAERLRQQELERRRLEEQRRLEAERARRRQELAEQKRREQERIAAIRQQREAEQKRLEELQRQREEAERRRREEQERLQTLEEQRQRAAEQAIREANEARARRAQEAAQRVASLRARYEAAIESAVTRNWLKPPSARPGLSCKVLVHQIPGGEVIDASILSCNGDAQARTSIVQAVLRASPLPYRGFEDVFQRELVFTFRPEE